ncbi:MAG: hypothetical protein KAS47_06850 [Candidatus Heimdallarchaeota archaeon]|nr:hypothetical protein [Candidatus Heimdallarchaeota archaeon]
MKVIFEPEKKQEISNHLETIAEHYQTSVLEQDIGEGKFVFVKSKIKIVEKFKDQKTLIYVWGAKDEDIIYLKKFFGEPVQKIIEKMTPLAFASEIIEIPNTDNLTKEDIMSLLDVTDRDLRQYSRMLRSAARRSSASIDIVKAYELLEKIL